MTDTLNVCEYCGVEKLEGHVCRGWAPGGKTSVQSLRRWRENVESVLVVAKWGQPFVTTSGNTIMREAWGRDGDDLWHLGLDERVDVADEKSLIIRGMVECEGRGVRVRLSPQMVDDIRRRFYSDLKGKSQ